MTRQTVLRVVLSLALVTVAAGTLAATAQADVRIGVSPARFDMEANPGDTGETEITVFNRGTEAFGVVAAIEPFPDAPAEHSAVDWLTAEPARFDLDPGEQQEVALRVIVPAGVPTGGRYARVTFTTETPGGPTEEVGVAVAGRLIVGVLMVVNGDDELSYEVEVERFGPILEPDGRIGFRALFANGGNVHVQPSGSVAINTNAGQSYGSLEFQEARTVIPTASEYLSTQGTIPLQEGEEYVSSLEVDYGQEEPIQLEVPFVMQTDVQVGDLAACENLDRGPTLSVPLINEGDVGIVPLLQVVVRDEAGNTVSSVGLPPDAIVWPHDELDAAADLPERLVTGDYVLVAEFRYGIEEPVTKELPFSIGGTGPNVAPICENPVLDDGAQAPE